ncbi:MAG: DUF3617 domain-containing protein [Sphingomonas sp.]|uniref:DUF3617 domain-containing protein n=1 Tax=Sphingomonas sp. TaxID=28214 RepID=UPI001ACFEDD0|nr:DUF3617 domain-containing protein [Sphingomonas sp.]MBN8814041.1 DUF3617 domain-containing protein [Sphingomonas sp.]
MRRFLLVTALLPLAACNSGPTVTATNASEAEVKAKVAAATGGADMISPGRWEGTMTINNMKMPKLPAEAQAKLAGRIGGAQKFVSCVTEEDVKAKRAFFTGDKEADKSCTYNRFTMGGGKIDAAMTCKNEGGNMTATMTGNFSPDSYHMEMASNTDSSSPYAAMSMKMTVDGKRTGACRGTEDKE